MIMRDIGMYQPNEMAFAENYDVFEELPSTGADPALRHRILPGTPVGTVKLLGLRCKEPPATSCSPSHAASWTHVTSRHVANALYRNIR